MIKEQLKGKFFPPPQIKSETYQTLKKIKIPLGNLVPGNNYLLVSNILPSDAAFNTFSLFHVKYEGTSAEKVYFIEQGLKFTVPVPVSDYGKHWIVLNAR